jgi:hypothetical protein
MEVIKMESILNNTQPINVIPAYASVEEHALYTIASVEESFTNICKEIGIYELSVCIEAEGKFGDKVKVAYDKSKLKVVWDKIAKFFRELWQKFQDLCATVKKKISDFVKDKVSKFKETKLNAKDLEEAIKASKEDRWSGKGIDTNDDVAKLLVTSVKRATEDVCAAIGAAKDDPEKIAEINVEEIYGKKCLSKIEGLAESDYTNAAKIRDAVKKAVMDEIKLTKDYAANNVKQYVSRNAVSEFVDYIKKPYNETKAALDTLIKETKKANTDNGFKSYIKAATVATRINSAVVGAIEAAYVKRLIFEFGVVFKAATFAALKSKAKEEAKQESAQVEGEVVTTESAPEVKDEPVTESSTFQTELASLFNF